jgi:hypothetical protein
MYSMSSTMIHGIERDARRVADTIAARIEVTAPRRSLGWAPPRSQPSRSDT